MYPCDLSDTDAIATMADKVLDDLGGVDILINNAGRSIRRSLELSYDRIHDYQRTMQLNYLGAVQLILKFIPGMRERGFGHIVNVSSVGVQTRAPRFGAYIASKAALDSLCDALQAETVSDGVRFTTVHMALVKTPMISPTTMYDKFPTLTPDQAAGVLADAIVHRPRRVSSPFGQFASFADAVNPAVMDRVRNRAFAMFDDSRRPRGPKRSDETPQFDKRSETFVRATRGIHWWRLSLPNPTRPPSSSPAPRPASAPKSLAGWRAAAFRCCWSPGAANGSTSSPTSCARALGSPSRCCRSTSPTAGTRAARGPVCAPTRSPVCATAPVSAPAALSTTCRSSAKARRSPSMRWR